MDPNVRNLMERAGLLTIDRPKFTALRVVATPGAVATIDEWNAKQPEGTKSLGATVLTRHFNGDWGDCDPEDSKTNDDALANGGRLMSVFKSDEHATLWVITEHDRSICTILLPEEY